MPNGLSGRAVIVTGAANGFGLATARRFAAAGASVMMADFDEDKLIRECETIAGEGHDGTVLSFHGDLREKLSMTNLMAATIDAFEGLHVLVNAARICHRAIRSTPSPTISKRPCGPMSPPACA